MDDPLIGLTIFDSRSKPSSSGPGRPVIASNNGMKQSTRRSENVDSNKLREEKGRRSAQCVVKDTRTGAKGDLTTEKAKTSAATQKSNSKGHDGKKTTNGSKAKPSRGSAINDDLDKCFPCLPGLEDPQKREEEEASGPSSSGSEAESTPSSPVPPLNSNHIDSGTSTQAPSDTFPSTPGVVDSNILLNSPVPQPQNFWLMRLFQSKLFDMSIAIGYLFNSKDSDVQAYLGNKLFVSLCSILNAYWVITLK